MIYSARHWAGWICPGSVHSTHTASPYGQLRVLHECGIGPGTLDAHDVAKRKLHRPSAVVRAAHRASNPRPRLAFWRNCYELKLRLFVENMQLPNPRGSAGAHLDAQDVLPCLAQLEVILHLARLLRHLQLVHLPQVEHHMCPCSPCMHPPQQMMAWRQSRVPPRLRALHWRKHLALITMSGELRGFTRWLSRPASVIAYTPAGARQAAHQAHSCREGQWPSIKDVLISVRLSRTASMVHFRCKQGACTFPQGACRLDMAVALRLCLVVLGAQPLGKLLHLHLWH